MNATMNGTLVANATSAIWSAAAWSATSQSAANILQTMAILAAASTSTAAAASAATGGDVAPATAMGLSRSPRRANLPYTVSNGLLVFIIAFLLIMLVHNVRWQRVVKIPLKLISDAYGDDGDGDAVERAVATALLASVENGAATAAGGGEAIKSSECKESLSLLADQDRARIYLSSGKK